MLTAAGENTIKPLLLACDKAHIHVHFLHVIFLYNFDAIPIPMYVVES